jgi:acetylornithine/LysW-gamma-L-lysine aminotransferase
MEPNIIDLENRHASGAVGRRPFVIVRAEGVRLWDEAGNEYIDCSAAHGWANVGHSHPVVTQAIQEQAARLVAWTESSYNDQRALWMRDLAALTPGDLNRIHPCNSGAEAIEAAIKAARFFTGRPNIIATQRGFHGRTFAAMTATWNKAYREPFEPLVPGFSHVPYNNVEAMAEAIDDQTAAVLVEVVQGEGGVYPGGPEYFAGLRQLCDQRGALLIFDEIQTGFGRTGKMFAAEHMSVVPDIMALGKGLGGGIPMGATIWSERLGTFNSGAHGGTFGGNPLACAASRAVMQVMRDQDLPARAARLGDWLLDQLRALASESPQVREVRGLGLMVGLQVRGRVTPVLKDLTEAGIWALPAGPTVLRLLPPLVISQADLETVVEKLKQVLQ